MFFKEKYKTPKMDQIVITRDGEGWDWWVSGVRGKCKTQGVLRKTSQVHKKTSQVHKKLRRFIKTGLKKYKQKKDLPFDLRHHPSERKYHCK